MAGCRKISLERLRQLAYLFRYIFLPNLIFGVLSTVVTTSRAWINIDYCLVGLLSPLIGRYWAAAIYLLLFILDLVTTFTPTYHLKPVILLTIFRELSAFDPIYLVLLLLLVMIPLLIMWFAILKKEPAPRGLKGLQGRVVLLVAPLCLIATDMLNGSNTLVHVRDNPVINYNIAGSALVKTVRDINTLTTKGKSSTKPLGPGEYATSGLWKELKAGDRLTQNIVLVIVESWGISSDSLLNQAIVSPLTSTEIGSRYNLKSGKIPFHGATVSAEIRELWGIRATSPNNVASQQSLPAMLVLKGFQTVSMHGFMPTFFGRNEWYPQAGFEKSLFFDNIDNMLPDHEKCGSPMFRGICDDRIPSLIRQMLVSQEAPHHSKFIYWLTLNSHYPFAAPEHKTLFKCDKYALSAQHQDICNLSSTIYSTLSALGSLAADPTIPPTRFIVVGDHSPPFLMRSKDGLYDKKFVPLVELIPNSSMRH